MTNAEIREILLDALALAWINGQISTVEKYMDCVRQVKERFND
jgi:hypothetical protein